MPFLAPEFLRNLEPNHPVQVTLIYLDETGGNVSLSYDSHDPSQAKSLPALKREGSGQWRMMQWVLTNPRFAQALNQADIRLESASGGPVTVSGLYLETAYPVPPEALPQPGIPRGELQKFTFNDSKIFPGTTREVTLYIPRQYDGSKPACVWVSQDGMPWNTHLVLDSLIARNELPAMIAIGITPGQIMIPGSRDVFRNNRSFEYDTLSDEYARFVTEEIFPAVEKLKTADGRDIKLSREARDCGIAGASSGGICAFTAAWECPERFSRVFSIVGSFDNLRNGDRYPGLIRKTEPRPIRVYLQSGSNDLQWYAGEWWTANQRTLNALKWAGYEVANSWSDGGHSGPQGFSVFPDALRYLWKDWPNPVGQGATGNGVFREILRAGEDWVKVPVPAGRLASLAANAAGEVFVRNEEDGSIHRVDVEGNVKSFAQGPAQGGQMACGSDGKLYQLNPDQDEIWVYQPNGEGAVFTTGLKGIDIASDAGGRIFVSEFTDSADQGRIWRFGPKGEKTLVSKGLPCIRTLTISSAQNAVYFGDGKSWLYSGLLGETLTDVQRWCELEIDTLSGDARIGGIVALDGRTLAGSQLGIQVITNYGVVEAIVPGPKHGVTDLVFGGPSFDHLYVLSDHQLFRRIMNISQKTP